MNIQSDKRHLAVTALPTGLVIVVVILITAA